MEVKSGALRSDTFPNSLFRAAVGDDGGTERSVSGALAERPFPNTQLRVVGGVSGGIEERSDCLSELSR